MNPRDEIPEFPEDLRDWRLVLEGPRRAPRRWKKEFKSAYLALIVSIMVDEREQETGVDHRSERICRRIARNCRFRCEAKP